MLEDACVLMLMVWSASKVYPVLDFLAYLKYMVWAPCRSDLLGWLSGEKVCISPSVCLSGCVFQKMLNGFTQIMQLVRRSEAIRSV